MKKVPETVNMATFAAASEEKPSADKPITVSKTERKRRANLRPGEIQVWRDNQRPEFKRKKVRKRKCPFCSYDFRGLRTVCPRCKNCQACGSYVGQTGGRVCQICGNTDSNKTPLVPTINIG